ncbi:hypothetical protein [Idiomarina seosinensis]|uniref:Uncharacterized protein n=1 Tax=Idiomarina seosinensis TaxID=281739 RepID=A0A432Z6Q1_9GAMM|nr:hypothetical protein [Idiomarina seosinensis]RUO73561.1 hypothetical protein CWI81_11065 [Idiomarina seosinensis]
MAEQHTNSWQWVASDGYEIPPTPTILALQRWWRSISAQWESDQEDGSAELGQVANSQPLQVDGADGIAALDQYLAEWLSNENDGGSLRWIISPPYSHVKPIAQDWLTANGFEELKIPNRDKLALNQLEGDISITGNGPWFVPELGHAFLRQSKGLRWVRLFFAKALSGELGKGVVICDSWAWQFLQQLWPVSGQQTLTLQAFDSERLRQLGLDRDEHQLKHLAALSRGNLGVACAYSNSSYHKRVGDQQSPFELPTMPVETTDYTAFILHALLLHCGLTQHQLQNVLPIVPPTHLDIELHQLRQCGLIELLKSNWQVTARGYPVVRQALVSRGLLADAF